MTTTNETYNQMRKRHREESNRMTSEKAPFVFFAFGDKQFEKAMSAYHEAGGSDDDLVYVGGGMYGQSDAVEEIADFWKSQHDERAEALNDHDFFVSAVKSEMDNYEYGWSESDEDVLEALGLDTDILNGDRAAWYNEAREAYLGETADYVW